jgi:hypothetical protein
MDTSIASPVIDTITGFLEELGLYGGRTTLDHPTFLPGVDIVSGKVVIDESKLGYPGDMLHEAGHLAVTPAAERTLLNGTVGNDAGEEMGAIAWSWAALLHLGIPPEVVFHPAGYHGGSGAIIENFTAGRYFGVPMLQWMGMTYGPDDAEKHGVKPFPHMIGWLRE